MTDFAHSISTGTVTIDDVEYSVPSETDQAYLVMYSKIHEQLKALRGLR